MAQLDVTTAAGSGPDAFRYLDAQGLPGYQLATVSAGSILAFSRANMHGSKRQLAWGNMLSTKTAVRATTVRSLRKTDEEID